MPTDEGKSSIWINTYIICLSVRQQLNKISLSNIGFRVEKFTS